MPSSVGRSTYVPKRLRRWPLLIAVVVCSLVLWRPVLAGVQAFMAVSDPLKASDFILPLYGNADAISEAAADLYARQLAPRLLLHRVESSRLEEVGLVSPTHVSWRRLLEARGVHGDAIETPGAVIRDHVELGRWLGRLAIEAGPICLIVVTSAPRSRLSRNALSEGLLQAATDAGMEAPPVELLLYPVAPRGVERSAWWRSRLGWIAYFDAYCLWLIQFLR